MLEFSLSMALGVACYALGRMHGWRKGVKRAATVVAQFADTWKGKQ